MSSGIPLLELRGVSKSFRIRGTKDVVKAVDHVDLRVMPRECLALVGESGSGKSTLARIALQLIAPDAGVVFLKGVSLTGMSGAHLRAARIAVQPIFQDPSAALNPRRRTDEMLLEALHTMHGSPSDRRDRAMTLLERVGLRPAQTFARRYPHELSGGQRQRLCIARAIAMEPALIIADEPLSGLDVSIRGQILNLLADLRAEREMALLLITHDLGVARALAERVAVMFHGNIVETGDTAAVLENPAHDYTRLLLSAAPRFTHLPAPSFATAAGR